MFFRWIYKQRTTQMFSNGVPIDTYYNEIREECNVLGKDLQSVELSKVFDNINTHGGSYSQSSIIMSIIDLMPSKIYFVNSTNKKS